MEMKSEFAHAIQRSTQYLALGLNDDSAQSQITLCDSQEFKLKLSPGP
jgi:hypothetical protein